MQAKDVQVANHVDWRRAGAGYLKKCRYCPETIYMTVGWDGVWRPYESWAAHNVNENEWVLHHCR